MGNLNTAQITTDVVTSLSNRFANYLVSKIKIYFDDRKAHEALIYQTAYEKYLYATKEKYEKVKTLLYKQTPQYLYDFYECLGVRNKKTIFDTNNINNLLEVGHKLIITGTGGIGKTIMMKHLFLNTIKETDCIPILIELRTLNENTNLDLKEVIFNYLKTFNFELEEKYFYFSLELGKYVVIFDGYDEVKSNLAKKVEEAILQLTNQFPDNYYIVSSRPMHNNFISWSDFVELEAMGLTKEQALNLVSKLKYDEKVKGKFYSALEEKLYDKYKTFASNPLLLTIMLMTFEEGGEIPESFNDFYEQAFTALYKTHDASKGAYVRDKASGLGFNEFKLIFSHVCFKSFFNNEYEFSDSEILKLIDDASNKCQSVQKFDSENFLKDLTDATCMLVRDGLNLRFSHRSFQEYFAAYYTTHLDDKTQRKLIARWLTEDGFFNTSEFVKILYDMIPERFEKNVMLPALKKIKCECEGLDDIDKFGQFFDQISLMENKKIYLSVTNHYYFTIYNLLHYKFAKLNNIKKYKNKGNAFYEKMVEKGYQCKKHKSVDVSLSEIKKDPILVDLFNSEFKLFFDIYDYGMQLLSNLNSGNSKKKKLSSLLDEL